MGYATFADRVRGVIFGQAIGDALGLGTELLSKAEVRRYYREGLTDYSQIRRDRHRSRWAQGDWTDDTDQMLCILDSILTLGRVDPGNIAHRLHQWAVGGGMGIGRTVANVVYAYDFWERPEVAAKRVWEASGCNSAANGGVMRTSVLGVWQSESRAAVRRQAEDVCRITHYDPRCVASCVVVCLAIQALVTGRANGERLVEELAAVADEYDPRVREFIDKAARDGLNALALDDADTMGYTLKAMGAGVWALLRPRDYREGLLAVIHEGGDADTNASVAGAVLGARFGFAAIPTPWVHGLRHGLELEGRVGRLLAMMSREDASVSSGSLDSIQHPG